MPVRIIGFCLYCALMIWLLFLQRIGRGAAGLNLVPFRTIIEFATAASRRAAVINLAGNVVMFIPLGFFLPWIWASLRKYGKCLLCMAVIIVSVELTQLILSLGSCDIDDLILNLIGGTIGFFLYIILKRALR